MSKKIKENEKKYTKRAILLSLIGVKKDIIKTLLNDNELYTLTQVENMYSKFLEGGNK